MKNVSRPASRSGPLAMPTSGTLVTPIAASTSRAALSWPSPPSMRRRSGQGDSSLSSPSPERGGSARSAGVGSFPSTTPPPPPSSSLPPPFWGGGAEISPFSRGPPLHNPLQPPLRPFPLHPQPSTRPRRSPRSAYMR